MTRALILLALLAGCTPPARPQFPACPPAVVIPAPLHKGENVGALEIRVELGREAERNRADACASTVSSMRAWIDRRSEP